ncbi:MAG: T9SS type A sorting domain-containing protein [Saprospiraceae bacterium]|nr:T9SS type A sorting domain-containing protein [Saprospiraceae bacterium]
MSNSVLTKGIKNLEKAPTACSMANITISTPTTWANQTLTFAPGERITITSTGSLTLINTTLTKSGSAKWHGIVLEGPSSSSPGGSIIVTTGSKIDHAQNGIHAPNGCNQVRLMNSEMNSNSTAIAIGSTSNLVKGNIFIFNSVINSDPNQVGIISNGANITVTNKSKLIGIVSTLGISSLNNKLTISNSIIKGYKKCINKEIGGLRNNRGLFIFHSLISGIEPITNMDALVDVKQSLIINGITRNFGVSKGNWHANTFAGDLWLRNSTLSQSIVENYFNKSYIILQTNQKLTNATCNTWYCSFGSSESGQPCNPNKLAVDGLSATITKLSWGQDLEELASGNKWLIEKLTMRSAASNEIKNVHYLPDQNQVFNYQMQFEAKDYFHPNTLCNYNLHPSLEDFEPTLNSIDEPVYDEIANNQNWISLHQEMEDVIILISNASPEELLSLQIKLESIQHLMGQSVLLALKNEDETMSQTNYNLWISRADPLLERRGQALELFINESFVDLTTYLNSISFNSVDQADVNILFNAINWMIEAKADGKNLLNLTLSDLENLTNFASSSFGEYTAILRGWLAINYQIYVYPPESINLETEKEIYYSETSLLGFELVSQNNSNCIFLKSITSNNSNYKLEVYDLNGSERISKHITLKNSVCIEHGLSTGIYILRIKDLNTSVSNSAKIIIK